MISILRARCRGYETRKPHNMKISHSSLYTYVRLTIYLYFIFCSFDLRYWSYCFFILHLKYFSYKTNNILCLLEFALDVPAYVNVVNIGLLIVLLCTSIVFIVPTAATHATRTGHKMTST